MRDRTEKSRQTLQRAAQAPWLTRREALGLLGAAAGLGLGTAVHGGQGLAVVSQTQFTSAEPPVFPAGAIIRTLRGDVAPETLANGATLFHEHLRGGVDLHHRGGSSGRKRRGHVPGRFCRPVTAPRRRLTR